MNGSPTPLPASASDAPLVRSRWRWWVHLVVLAIMPLLALLSLMDGMEMSGPALTRSARGLLIVCGWQLFFFALLFALAWIFSRASFDDLLCRWRGGIWPVPLAILYSVVLRLGVGIVVGVAYAVYLAAQGATPEVMEQSLLKNRPAVETLVDVAALRDNPAYFWLNITLISFVLAGLREELWRAGFIAALRALWPQWFASKAGQIVAVGVAALFFGVGHVRMGPLAVAMTTLLGFGLGVIMVLHRSIWPAVITHGLFNATTFAILPWMAEKLPELQKSLIR